MKMVDVEDENNDLGCNEDVVISQLVIPEKAFQGCYEKFAFCVNERAFSSWVLQMSPACAAASVASAVNVLRGVQSHMVVQTSKKKKKSGKGGFTHLMELIEFIVCLNNDILLGLTVL